MEVETCRWVFSCIHSYRGQYINRTKLHRMCKCWQCDQLKTQYLKGGTRLSNSVIFVSIWHLELLSVDAFGSIKLIYWFINISSVKTACMQWHVQVIMHYFCCTVYVYVVVPYLIWWPNILELKTNVVVTQCSSRELYNWRYLLADVIITAV